MNLKYKFLLILVTGRCIILDKIGLKMDPKNTLKREKK